ncbi:hypothetical protein Fmac_026868 [Flemingia macrophylla]|uniref:Glutamate 5-kinase n=1 Tax=Flemingia macrophylla TaxID=520843 RepID=A0ABD1LG36_9FABA
MSSLANFMLEKSRSQHGELDMTSAQLLVTDNDFKDKNFRKQLSETVKSLLALKVIPIFNDNGTISTRKAPCEALSSEERKQILLRIVDALEANQKEIKIENEVDVVAAQEAGYEKSLVAKTLAGCKPFQNIRIIANMEDPIGRVLKRTEVIKSLL